jgi:hypothetical protein
MKRLFSYIRFYFEPNEKELGREAYLAAKTYYALRPLRNPSNMFPRVAEYNQRREDFIAFQRGYKNNYRHSYAMAKLKDMTWQKHSSH